MQISLDKLTRGETDKLDLNFSRKIDTINYCENSYKLASPINANGKVSITNKGLYLDVDINFTILDNCARCLVEVEVPIEYSIKGFLVKENYDEDSFEDDDAFIYDGQELNLLDIIEQTLDFKIPARVLCKEDCEGLCQGCGANLNKEECSCNETANDEEIIDPRFAKLKDIFKND
ncbi:YceD family protein [Romboutsia sp.]|uniref:YceD family protein n=1 Tax=Romboutsia sp. TaxID=1965302 RepID=UPI003F3B52D3